MNELQKSNLIKELISRISAHLEAPVESGLAKVIKDVIDSQNPSATAIKYIGKRDYYSDALFGTGAWLKNQVKLIENSTAAKMIGHPGVYVPVNDEVPQDAEVVDVPEKKHEPDTLVEGRRAIMSMESMGDVASFVASNFAGISLDVEKMKGDVQEAKLMAIQLLDRFHLPETFIETKAKSPVIETNFPKKDDEVKVVAVVGEGPTGEEAVLRKNETDSAVAAMVGDDDEANDETSSAPSSSESPQVVRQTMAENPPNLGGESQPPAGDKVSDDSSLSAMIGDDTESSGKSDEPTAEQEKAANDAILAEIKGAKHKADIQNIFSKATGGDLLLPVRATVADYQQEAIARLGLKE